jgi:ribosomal-protein-alanine N-acetyltransferase
VSGPIEIVPATPAEAAAMAQAHAGAFDPPWREEDFEDLLEGAGIYGFVARNTVALGVILCRVAADEMEVLTLGVTGEARRRGVARALMTAGLGAARQAGAAACFLEVAVDNPGAIALYESLGFRRAGLRRGYYDRGAAGLTDALVMRRELNAAAA